jgi:hypothetical protein
LNLCQSIEFPYTSLNLSQYLALEKITSRVVPQDGWGIEFPSMINLPEEKTLPLQIDKKKRNEAYSLFKDDHITTLQSVQKQNIWWFKAIAEAAQKTKHGIFSTLNQLFA